ncbi:MAG TPA: hypothetical protein VIC51_04355 [Psychromonas sp.]
MKTNEQCHFNTLYVHHLKLLKSLGLSDSSINAYARAIREFQRTMTVQLTN